MVDWKHNGKSMLGHSDFDDTVVGFVYEITYSNGKRYIGSKLIKSLVRLKPTKEQLKLRKNYVRKELVSKPFINYTGSSKLTKELEIVSREILELASTKIDLRYMETKWLFRKDVLCNDEYMNANINGTYYRGKITKGL